MRCWLILVAMAFAACLLAQDEAPKEVASVSAAMAKRAESLTMTWQDETKQPAPTLFKTPLLRCNDPTRSETDGAVWMWLDGKRPVTAMCIILYANGKWNYEFVSLCDMAPKVTGRPTWQWEPKAVPRPWTKLDEPVPITSRNRQLAMRAITRRIEAVEFYKGQSFVLRLLNRPLISYADEENGVLEGAVFTLANGTNPEVLVQLEARRGESDSWHISFARLSIAALNVKYDDAEIWAVPKTEPRQHRETYYAVNELPTNE